jgi:hypothetical protein
MWMTTVSISSWLPPFKKESRGTTMNLEATDRTPAISLTRDPLKLSISGESFPEDVSAFYGDIISAINQLATTAKGKLEVEMAMVYINSSSIKAMYRIFEGLDAYRQAGNEVQVTWKAEADDDIMQELGEDFKDRFQALSFSVEQHG